MHRFLTTNPAVNQQKADINTTTNSTNNIMKDITNANSTDSTATTSNSTTSTLKRTRSNTPSTDLTVDDSSSAKRIKSTNTTSSTDLLDVLDGTQTWHKTALEFASSLNDGQTAAYAELMRIISQAAAINGQNGANGDATSSSSSSSKQASSPTPTTPLPDLTTTLLTLTDLTLVSPRGRFDLLLLPSHIILQPKTATGKTFVVEIHRVSRVTSFKDVNGRDVWLGIGLSAATSDDLTEIAIKLNATGKCKAKDFQLNTKQENNSNTTMTATVRQHIERTSLHTTALPAIILSHPALSALTLEQPDKMVFHSTRSQPGVSAYWGTKDGSAYFLPSCVCFRPAPLSIPITDIQSMTTSGGAKQTCDVTIELTVGSDGAKRKPVILSMIDDAEQPRIENYIDYVQRQQRKLSKAATTAKPTSTTNTPSKNTSIINIEEDSDEDSEDDSDYTDESSSSSGSDSGSSSDDGEGDGEGDGNSGSSDGDEATDDENSNTEHSSSSETEAGDEDPAPSASEQDDDIDMGAFHASKT